MPIDNDYTLGRGEVWFDRFLPNTKTKTGERYFGNSPDVTLSQSEEKLEHFSSDAGVKEKDASVTLSQDTTGKITVDNISKENMALWWLGDAAAITVGSAIGVTEVHLAKRGTAIQLGTSDDVPQGTGDVDNVVVSSATGGTPASGSLNFTGQPSADDTVTLNGSVITFKASGAVGAQVNIGGSPTLTAQALKTYINAHSALGVTAAGDATILTLTAIAQGTTGNAYTLAKSGTYPAVSAGTLTGGLASGTIDAAGNYELDLGTGRILILDNAADIADGDSLSFVYDQDAMVLQTVISKGDTIYGALRFISKNPIGTKRDAFFPYVKIAPDGDFSLKGDDWQVLNFSLEILKLNSTIQRVYWTDRAAS